MGHTEGKCGVVTVEKEVVLCDEKGHIICNFTVNQPDSYIPTAKANADQMRKCWNNHDNLLEACQGSVIIVNEVLSKVAECLAILKISPLPAPPLEGIKQAIRDAGGKVFETANEAAIARADSEQE